MSQQPNQPERAPEDQEAVGVADEETAPPTPPADQHDTDNPGDSGAAGASKRVIYRGPSSAIVISGQRVPIHGEPVEVNPDELEHLRALRGHHFDIVA